MFGLGPTEIAIILILGLLLFGAKKLPELGRSIGQGLREFKNASKQIFDDDDSNTYTSSENTVRQIEVEARDTSAGKAEAPAEKVAVGQPDAD
jgi:sec-independent protein translocase protein TatA